MCIGPFERDWFPVGLAGESCEGGYDEGVVWYKALGLNEDTKFVSEFVQIFWSDHPLDGIDVLVG